MDIQYAVALLTVVGRIAKIWGWSERLATGWEEGAPRIMRIARIGA